MMINRNLTLLLCALLLSACGGADGGTGEGADANTAIDVGTTSDATADTTNSEDTATPDDFGDSPQRAVEIHEDASPPTPDNLESQSDAAPVDPLTQPQGIVMGQELVASWSAFQVNSYLAGYFTGLTSSTGVEIYHLLYSVQNPPGTTSQAASALAVFPADPEPAEPPVVITWNHGTTGGGDSCAPSAAGTVGAFYGIVLASMGYATVLPDYPGLGSPGPHPYMVRDVTGMAVVDGVRAIRALGEDVGHPLSNEVGSMGHSQGGHATMSAHDYFEGPYGEGLDYLGAVAYAPGGAFARTFEEMANSSPAPSAFLAMMWLSWLRREDLPPSTVFRAPYDTQLPDWVETYCLSQLIPLMPALNTTLFHAEVLDSGKTGYADDPVLGPIVDGNTPPKTPTTTPLLIMQGENDTLVFPAIADWITEISCDVGAAVELRKVPLRDHMTIVYADMIKEGADWIEARRNQEPWSSDCP